MAGAGRAYGVKRDPAKQKKAPSDVKKEIQNEIETTMENSNNHNSQFGLPVAESRLEDIALSD